MTKTSPAAIARGENKPMPRPQIATETAVMKATRSILAKLDARRGEIARLRIAVQAALA
jgi:hypothetical protein